MILIPVKNLANAKQRLGDVLDQSIRTQLAHAMLADVLEAVAEYGREDACLVTSDPFALDQAAKLGFGVITDPANTSETDAIEMATRECAARGIQRTLVIPGDIPLIEAEDLATIFEHAPAEGTVLVPCRDKRGTNAALRAPSDLFPLRFGNHSFPPHLQAAVATDTVCIVLSLPRIGLDVDNVEDLQNLAAQSGTKRAQELARKLSCNGVLPRSIAARDHRPTAVGQ
ncbi:MAG TPA: 2-phospho-L-lactate guanylyltransferase [Terriglobales bacterium]|nr:2-phospho-L-lactate guanylyltransferase [Terriglobales bacterium]